MRTIVAALLFVAVGAVALADPAREAPPPATRSAEQGARTPLVVKWKSPELKNGSLTIVAQVLRATRFGGPLAIFVVVPKGARLVKGEAAFQVPAGTPAGTDERAFTLQFDRTPADDLVLVADVSTSDFGAHGEDVYRFGRAAPTAPAPAHDGAEVKVGGYNLGRSVQMPPPTK